MKFEFVLYLVGAVFVSQAAGLIVENHWKKAGVVAALDMNVFRNAKDFHWSSLMSLLNGVSIPDLSFHNGHLNSNVFYITEDSKNVKAESLENQTTIRLSASDLQAGLISQNFTYDLFFFSAFSTLEARFTHMNFEISFDNVSKKGEGEDDQESFAIVVNSVKIDLPTEHMDITIHGNYFTNLANTFKGLYVNTLRKKMERHLENIVRSKFPDILNRGLHDKETSTKFSDSLSFDWHLSGRPENQMGKLVFGLQGLTSVNDSVSTDRKYKREIANSLSYIAFSFDEEGGQNFQATIDKDGNEEDNDMVLKLLQNSQHIDVLQMLRLSDLKVDDRWKNYYQLSAHASFIAPKFTPHTLPHIGGKWSFWHEHLNPAGVHTRKLSKPLAYTLHIWLQQYYDKFGFIKMMDKVYTPMLYKLLGEKNPEEEH